MIVRNDKNELKQALDYVDAEIKKYNLNKRDAMMAMLLAEESIVCMMDHSPEGSEIDIAFRKNEQNLLHEA